MPPTTALSNFIGQVLAETGLSDRQLEAKTGISRATLRRRLANQGQFTVAELERIADLRKMSLSALIAESERAA